MSGTIRNLTLGSLFAILLIAMTVQSVAASSSVPTAPVYVHFKPKSVKISCIDCSIKITVIAKNKGSSSAEATSCQYWFDGTLEPGCPLSNLPITIAPNAKETFSWTQKIGNLTAGTYSWKFVFLGTYNGVSSKSHPAKFTLIETA